LLRLQWIDVALTIESVDVNAMTNALGLLSCLPVQNDGVSFDARE